MRLFKPFLIIFVLFLILFNWNDISWVFNYNFVSNTLYEYFNKNSEENAEEYYQIEDSIEIPAISVYSKLVIPADGTDEEVNIALEKGAVILPGYSFPGESGETFILGHSAPSSWPKTNLNYWLFNDLDKLKEADQIFIYFNNKKYEYSVSEILFLEEGSEISKEILTEVKNMLLLVSCWPPETGTKRIVVKSILVE